MSRKEVKKKYIYTGFSDLDWKTGGFRRKEVIILGGRPSSGKKTFAASCLCNLISKERYNILWISLTSDRNSFITRLTRSYLRLDISGCDCYEETNPQIKGTAEKIFNSGFDVRYIKDGSRKIETIIKKCQKYAKDRHSIDLVVIDSLEMIDSKKSSKYNTAEILKKLKRFAVENNCCVLILTALKGGIDKRSDRVPRLTDLKYKRTISIYADQIWALSNNGIQPENGEDDSLPLLYILKGNKGYINLVWLKRFGLMVAPKTH